MEKFSTENCDESLNGYLLKSIYTVKRLCYTVYLATLFVTLKYNCDT